jgi:hypothetical protein
MKNVKQKKRQMQYCVHIAKYKNEFKKVKFTLEQDLKAQRGSRGAGTHFL